MTVFSAENPDPYRVPIRSSRYGIRESFFERYPLSPPPEISLLVLADWQVDFL